MPEGRLDDQHAGRGPSVRGDGVDSSTASQHDASMADADDAAGEPPALEPSVLQTTCPTLRSVQHVEAAQQGQQHSYCHASTGPSAGEEEATEEEAYVLLELDALGANGALPSGCSVELSVSSSYLQQPIGAMRRSALLPQPSLSIASHQCRQSRAALLHTRVNWCGMHAVDVIGATATLPCDTLLRRG